MGRYKAMSSAKSEMVLDGEILDVTSSIYTMKSRGPRTEHQKLHLQQQIVRHQLRKLGISQPSSYGSSGRVGGRVEE